MKEAALNSVAAGNDRACTLIKRVVSYLFDHPEEAPHGSMAFIRLALLDQKHPARNHRIHPQLDSKVNLDFIVDLSNCLTIFYDAGDS
jgi:hypothetical protein